MIGINFIQTARLEDVAYRYTDRQIEAEILRIGRLADNHSIEQDRAQERINTLKAIIEGRRLKNAR